MLPKVMILPIPLRSGALCRIGRLLVAGTLGIGASCSLLADSSPLTFAWQMAKGGNWREAKFRWELELKRDPDNARMLNNLAVAQEALGQPDAARSTYGLALKTSAGEPSIEDNRQRFEQFWNARGGSTSALEIGPPVAPGRSQGKATKLPVELPVPPRIAMKGIREVLVTRFLADETPLFDIDREVVRFLRDELRKCIELAVLPVTPAPAIPEQTLDGLATNREFWKRLGGEHGADLIVSGAVRFERRDSSGFRDVDTISSVTGQKVRETRFVEQERFVLDLDVLFLDGASGDLLFRDHLSRAAVIAGTHNDPITAFFELGDALAPDILAIVKGRKQQETRYVFKR
jgi:hypothetical protein